MVNNDIEKIIVSDADIITSYGLGIDKTWKGLLSGKTAIKKNLRFSTENITSEYAALVPEVSLGNKDSIVIQMLKFLAINYKKNVSAKPDFLILATTVGEIDLLEEAVTKERDEDIINSSLDQLLCKICSLFDVEDGMIILAACASSTSAIIHASELIKNDKKKSIVVVGCDSVSEFVSSGFSALQALDRMLAKPFDKERAGLTVGEGAGYMVLTKRSFAEDNKLPNYGYIEGWGMTNDANHMTGPSRDGSGLSAAINKTIFETEISSNNIGFICSHGTGTVYNDLMEMKAFKKSLDNSVPTFSVKGAIGHTMGAAGLIETVLTLKSLNEGKVPPTIGLSHPIEESKGWVSSESQFVAKEYALNVNAGFGGVNAALLIRKGQDLL